MLNNIGFFSQFFDDLGIPDVLDPTGIFPRRRPLNPYKRLPGKSKADSNKRRGSKLTRMPLHQLAGGFLILGFGGFKSQMCFIRDQSNDALLRGTNSQKDVVWIV